jgi:hypothetical protein
MRLVEWVSPNRPSGWQRIGISTQYHPSLPLLTIIDASKALVTCNRFPCDPAYHWLIEREH